MSVQSSGRVAKSQAPGGRVAVLALGIFAWIEPIYCQYVVSVDGPLDTGIGTP